MMLVLVLCAKAGGSVWILTLLVFLVALLVALAIKLKFKIELKPTFKYRKLVIATSCAWLGVFIYTSALLQTLSLSMFLGSKGQFKAAEKSCLVFKFLVTKPLCERMLGTCTISSAYINRGNPNKALEAVAEIYGLNSAEYEHIQQVHLHSLKKSKT
jgi:hypothetical protein